MICHCRNSFPVYSSLFIVIWHRRLSRNNNMQLKQLFHTQILSCYFFFPDELCEACIHTCDHALLIQQTTLVIYNLKYDICHTCMIGCTSKLNMFPLCPLTLHIFSFSHIVLFSYTINKVVTLSYLQKQITIIMRVSNDCTCNCWYRNWSLQIFPVSGSKFSDPWTVRTYRTWPAGIHSTTSPRTQKRPLSLKWRKHPYDTWLVLRMREASLVSQRYFLNPKRFKPSARTRYT